MRITGTGKADLLIGTAGDDSINGGNGNDTIISGAGTDWVTGGHGADTFVITDQSQFTIITDFNPAEGDRIEFNFGGTTSASIYSGPLSDGMTFQTAAGACSVHCLDYNGDGIMDTQLSIDGHNMFLLGCQPAQVSAADIIPGH
jgi:Ca2+-binding RTX toxin-like protein